MTSHIVLLIALASAILLIRYLAIDPGFGIKTRAAGALALAFQFGPRDIVYGDVDQLGLINDALSDATRGVVGHDRFNALMRVAIRRMRRADVALVYGGDEIRWCVAPRSGRGFCYRLQDVLQALPLSEDERARVQAATGRPYISITLAYEPSRGVLTHGAALQAAKARVQGAKPKGVPGRRGQVVA